MFYQDKKKFCCINFFPSAYEQCFVIIFCSPKSHKMLIGLKGFLQINLITNCGTKVSRFIEVLLYCFYYLPSLPSLGINFVS